MNSSKNTKIKENSTTGSGASFQSGTGEQISTPKAFKRRLRISNVYKLTKHYKKYKNKKK